MLFIGIFSCSDVPSKRLQDFQWLIGRWENTVSGNTSVEIWHLKNDSTLQGLGFQLANDDTVFREDLEIRQREDKVFFRTQISLQEITDFELVSDTPDTLIFANVSNDFPTEVRYIRISKDSMVSKIFGTVDEEEREITFPMAKRN